MRSYKEGEISPSSAEASQPDTGNVTAGRMPAGGEIDSVSAALLSGALPSVGNGTIARLMQVQRQSTDTGSSTTTPPAPLPATVPPRRNYVFLMGDHIRDQFYVNAQNFFRQHEPAAQLVTGKRTLAQIIDHVNSGGVPVLKLFIVSHANEEGNLGFSLNAADLANDAAKGDHKPRTTFAEVRDANAAGGLPTADVTLIDDVTKIEIKGCNIGRSQLMLDQIDTAFGGHGEVIAPTHKQEYSTRGRGARMVTDEAFLPYFLEQPGDQTISDSEIATQFSTKYPGVPATQWPALLRGVRRRLEREQSYQWTGVQPPADDAQEVIARLGAARRFAPAAGWTLTYNGRTVVGDEYHYSVRAERMTPDGSEWHDLSLTAKIPPDAATLEAQQRADHGRPDAYTWSVVDQVTGTQLVRRVIRERTEWTIDRRVSDATGVAHPPESDQTFYGHSTVTPVPAPTP